MKFRGLHQRGLALILVIVVISALLIIATPFAISMRLEEKSSAMYSYQVEAELLARASRNHVVAQLYQTHEHKERKKFISQAGKGNQGSSQEEKIAYNDHRYDGPAEFQPQWPKNFGKDLLHLKDGTRHKGKLLSESRRKIVFKTKDGRRTFSAFDVKTIVRSQLTAFQSQGSMMEVKVEDEQGKIDLNTAPPRVIGVILGATILSANIEAKDTTIPVLDTSPFYTDHNPKTIDGILRLGSEFIAYRDLGEIKTEDGTVYPALKGCLRGLYLTNLLGENILKHNAGTLIYDARATKISYHPVWSKPGEYRPFESLAQVREISNWTLLELMVQILRSIGVTPEILQGAGIDDKAMAKAGLAMEYFKKEAKDLTTKEIEILNKLQNAGVDMSYFKARGRYYLKRYLERLSKWSEERLKRYLSPKRVKRTNDRLQRRQVAFKGFQEVLKQNFPKALENMAELFASTQKSGFTIEAIGAVEMERLKRYFTLHPKRMTKWSDYRPLLRDIEPRPYRWYTVARVPRTPEMSGFAAVEIRRKGGASEFRKARRVSTSSRGTVIVLVPPLENIYESHETEVRGMMRPRVNVNSAPLPVLRALFTGLQFRGSKDYVSLTEADYLARVIDRERQKGGIRSFDHLGKILYENATEASTNSGGASLPQGYSEGDARAVLANAVSPTSLYVRRGTCGFTFTSGNIFRIEARGVVNSETGHPLASHSFREVIDVSPPGKLTRVWDSQYDFTSHFRLFNRTLIYPGKRLRHLDTFPLSPYVTSIGGNQWAFPDSTPGRGEFRLSRVRMPDSQYYTKHFDRGENWVNEGLKVENQPHLAPTAAQNSGKGGLPTNVVTIAGNSQTGGDFPILAPGRVEFWVKPVQLGGGVQTLFDMGHAATMSRVHLYYSNGERKLFFSIYDDCLDSRATTLEANVTLQANVWYHICIYWSGSSPGEMALFVDGNFVGQHQRMTELTAGVDETSDIIRVKSTANFPPQGVLQIGGEVCAYSAKRGNGFQLVKGRVQVGTDSKNNPIYQIQRLSRVGRAAHGRGTPVRLFGYAIPLIRDLVVGKNSLAYDLPTPTQELKLNKARPNKPIGTQVEPNDSQIKLMPKDYLINKNNEITLPNGKKHQIKYTVNDFPPQGFILVEGDVQDPIGALPKKGSEIMFYGKREGTTFDQLLRGQMGSKAVRFLRLLKITLLSIRVSNPADYPDQGKLQIYKQPGEMEWIRYRKSKTKPNFFILGFLSQRGNDPTRNSFLQQRDYGPGQQYLNQTKTHKAGEAIMPVYPITRGSYMGAGDVVTLYDRSNVPDSQKRSRMQISRVVKNEFAFNSHLPRLYQSFIKAFGLILKWPSGILPLHVSPQMTFGGPSAPPASGGAPSTIVMSGIYDEIVTHRVPGKSSGGKVTYGPGNYFRFGDDKKVYLREAISDSLTSIPLASQGTKKQLDNMKVALANLKRVQKPSKGQKRQMRRLERTIKLLSRRFSARKATWKSFYYWFVRPDSRFLAYGGRSDLASASERGQILQRIRDGGLVLLGDEVIFTSGIDYKFGSLKECVRGLLSSRARDHGAEEALLPLSWPLAGKVISIDAARYHLATTRPSPFPAPRKGHVFFTNSSGQMGSSFYTGVRFSRTRLGGNRRVRTIVLNRPRDYRGRPLLQECFGTRHKAANGDVAIFLPWRYEDRYQSQVDSEDIAYFQISFEPGNAYFRKVNWQALGTEGTVVRIRARIDGKPSWEASPNKSFGGYKLYEFTDAKDAWIGKSGDRIELRVYFSFRQGAYNGGQWKETPALKKLGVEYKKKTQVLFREVLPK